MTETERYIIEARNKLAAAMYAARKEHLQHLRERLIMLHGACGKELQRMKTGKGRGV